MDQAPTFQKAVTAAKPRLRPGFIIALFVTMALGLVALLVRPDARDTTSSVASASTNVRCTPLDAEIRIRDPKMTDAERVICLAVAGKIDQARARLIALSADDRSRAIQAVFTIAHPIADAGDDLSAGPIMGFVVEFWPANFMAVFHAGMSEFALGRDDAAQAQLTRFLEMYSKRDVWRARAEKALSDIASHTPIEAREAHFAE